MSGNTNLLTGMAVGFGLMFIFFIVSVLSPGRRKKGKSYDERQLQARNKAYKTSFLFLLLYCTVCGVLEIFGIKWATMAAMLFIGVFGSVTLFAVICILKDAYNNISRKKYPNEDMAFFLLFGVYYCVKLISDIHSGSGFFKDGLVNENVFFLLFAVMCLSIFLARVVSIIIKKAADDE